MRIVVVGGSGYVGNALSAKLANDGYQVVNISRTGKGNRYATGFTFGHLQPQCEGALAVVNLAGSRLDKGRWTAARRHEHYVSRVETTRIVADAIGKCTVKPALINMSATGYYGNTMVPSNEAHGHGQTYLARLCADWEAEANKIAGVTRVAVMRMGVILDRSHGALPKLMRPMQFFCGGPLGRGTQYLPWIHHLDAIEALAWATTRADAYGPYNVVAPEAVNWKTFMKTLGSVMGRPSWLRIPELPLRLLIGRMAETVVDGQYVVPMRLQHTHFSFAFPTLRQALMDLLAA